MVIGLATAFTTAASAQTPAAPETSGETTDAPLIDTSVCDALLESLVGDVYDEGRWRPLSLGTFFVDGWNEPWAAAPAGESGLTPRQGWLGAFNGLFFRLWLTTFSFEDHIKTPPGADRYTGTYDIYLPLSRRLEVLFEVPFVVANRAPTPRHGYTAQVGDLLVVPRFMLAESVATTHVFDLDIRTATGTKDTGSGIMSLQPRYAFWTNPGGAWVVRGGWSVFVPMNTAQSPAHTSYVGDLAIGRYCTPHDVPFGDLAVYVASNWSVPLDGTSKTETFFGVGPGVRFHIADNWFFLNYWQFPLIGPHPEAYTMQVALLKVF
jgi:hypothetical protein